MQDKYKLELTNEEYEFVMQVKNDWYKKLSIMSEEKRLAYFRKLYFEKNLNFEKEINGTIYKVNSYFNTNANETIANKISRLVIKESEN